MIERPLSRGQLLRHGRNLGLTVAASSFLTACGTAVATHTGVNSARRQGSDPPPKYLVMLIVDAGRPDYLNYTHLPNISALTKGGTVYERAWVGQLEAVTPACHASIGSGCFPSRDGGLLGFWWEDPATGTTFNSVPLDGVDPDALSNLMANAGTPTMAEFLKRYDSRAKVYTASAQKFYAADAVGGQSADFVSYYREDDHQRWAPTGMPGRELPRDILDDQRMSRPMWAVRQPKYLGHQDALVGDLALEVVRKERPRVVILNLPEMDWPVAHIDGGPVAPSAVITLMENADRVLGKLMRQYRHLGIYDDTIWMLMGDHGVTPTQQWVNSWGIKNAVETGTGDTVVTLESHTASLLWMAHPELAAAAANHIERSPDVAFVSGVYYLSAEKGVRYYRPAANTAAATPPTLRKALQYLMSTMNGANAPHVVCVFPERTGTLGAGGGRGVEWLGDHGGTSWGSQAIPLVMAGPGIKSGFVSNYPARLVDVAPTAMRLLGVPYPKVNGVVLSDAMTNPLPSDRSRQDKVASYIRPYAEALQSISAREAARMGPLNTIQPSSVTYPVKQIY